MLAAFSGPQSSGKTTLSSVLADKYPSIVRKTSRSILSDWGITLSQVNNDRPLTIKFQEEILRRKIEDESEAVTSDKAFLCDRSFSDLFTYALIAVGKDNEYSEWLDRYYEKCVKAQKAYSHVFYLPGGFFAPVDDGIRGVNQHYSRLVDLTLIEYTKRMTPVSLTILDVADLQERANWVDRVLQGKGKLLRARCSS